MQRSKSRAIKLAVTAMLTALCCVATMVVQVPSPTGGYLNLGDAVVILSALFLGPWLGAVVGGIGSAMADFLAGYMMYVPGTLVIKALMGLCVGLIHKHRGNMAAAVGAVAAESIMIAGYYLYTAVFLGLGFAGALAEIPGNCVQGAFGAVVGCMIYFALNRVPYVHRLMES